VKILIIEDEPVLGQNIMDTFIDEKYHAEWVDNGEVFHLIILDILLPDINGLIILKRIRKDGIQTPVILLTALGTVSDKVTGLDEGADDYLTKPFAMAELMARARMLLRRSQPIKTNIIEISGLVIDTASRTISCNGDIIPLTPKEFQIIEFLAYNKNRAVSRLTLAEHVWEDNFETMTNFVDVHIKNIRKKIDPNSNMKMLQTIRGIGYMLKDD
jgi:DNA-binding response OmpR family regulator